MNVPKAAAAVAFFALRWSKRGLATGAGGGLSVELTTAAPRFRDSVLFRPWQYGPCHIGLSIVIRHAPRCRTVPGGRANHSDSALHQAPHRILLFASYFRSIVGCPHQSHDSRRLPHRCCESRQRLFVEAVLGRGHRDGTDHAEPIEDRRRDADRIRDLLTERNGYPSLTNL